MRVLLINPSFRKSEKSYPLGLGYIGSSLRQDGHNVYGADLSFNSFSEIDSLIEEKEIGIVGITLMSYSFETAYKFCKKLKRKKDIPIIAGGPHATILKEELLSEYGNCFDYIIVGEGEYASVELLDAIENELSLSCVHNLIFKEGDKIISNISCMSIENLDFIPFPDRDIFPIFSYKGMLINNKFYTQIITSRGCNNRCSYCPESALWKKWYGCSVDNVIKEIGEIIDIYGIKEIHIEDANFFGGGVERVKSLCEKLIEKSMNIKWRCPNGIPSGDIDDESIFEFMARAGCYSICLSVETFDDSISKSVRRYSDFNKIQLIIAAAQRAGIEVTGYFIIGLPGQKFVSVIRDIYMALKLKFDFYHFSIFHLIPGSHEYNKHSSRFTYKQIIEKEISVSVY
jgi:radical SAM superfamily enzyme YgiQ (UPF0313 family)